MKSILIADDNEKILDVMMTEIDGFEVCRKIHGSHYHDHCPGGRFYKVKQ